MKKQKIVLWQSNWNWKTHSKTNTCFCLDMFVCLKTTILKWETKQLEMNNHIQKQNMFLSDIVKQKKHPSEKPSNLKWTTIFKNKTCMFFFVWETMFKQQTVCFMANNVCFGNHFVLYGNQLVLFYGNKPEIKTPTNLKSETIFKTKRFAFWSPIILEYLGMVYGIVFLTDGPAIALPKRSDPVDCCFLHQTNPAIQIYSISVNPHMGLSENSVPLNPMVNDHYPY